MWSRRFLRSRAAVIETSADTEAIIAATDKILGSE